VAARARALHSAHRGRDFAAFSGRRSAAEGVLGDAKQAENLTLQVGELGGKNLGDAVVADQGMPLGQAEQSEDLFGGWPFAGSLFRVERQLLYSPLWV